METKHLFFSCALLFFIIPASNTSNESNLLKYYAEFVKDLVSNRINGTNFCQSILMPSEFTLKRSLEATFVNTKNGNGKYPNESVRVDLCCRSLHKCDAHKRIELRYTVESHTKHCECEHSFQKCLKNLNASLSNDIAFVHTINTTDCYAIDHPIIECAVLHAPPNNSKTAAILQSMNPKERRSNRCLKYDLDESQPQKLQIFGVSFNNHAISAFESINTTTAIEQEEVLKTDKIESPHQTTSPIENFDFNRRNEKLDSPVQESTESKTLPPITISTSNAPSAYPISSTLTESSKIPIESTTESSHGSKFIGALIDVLNKPTQQNLRKQMKLLGKQMRIAGNRQKNAFITINDGNIHINSTHIEYAAGNVRFWFNRLFQ